MCYNFFNPKKGAWCMAYNHQYVKSFLVGLLFGKGVDPNTPPQPLLSVVNEDDVLLAVKKAYIDMSPRTFTKSEKKKEFDENLKNSLLSSLARDIRNYMEKGTGGKSFDEWHHEICRNFLFLYDLTDGKSPCEHRGLAGLLSNAGRKSGEATYGKAQKIVNMTFKYLYCYSDAPDYYERFEPCHMPLDSYILDWFLSIYAPIWEKGSPKGDKLTLNGKNRLPKWSNLDYLVGGKYNPGQDIPQYIEIQEAIKVILKSYNVTRLEAEFIIWYEAKNKLPFTYQ